MDPDRDWDVIVVGAGLGGLIAAARLLREGLRVLVVDAAIHPGGTAYVYRRGRFLFPMGPTGCANPGLVRELLSRAGLGALPSFRRVDYGLHAFGISLTLSRPFPETAYRLSRFFPEEEKAIRKFFRDMEFIAARLPALPLQAQGSAWSSEGGRDDLRFPPRPDPTGKGEPGTAPECSRPSPSASASSYLEELVKDGRLRRILGGIGTREPHSNLALLSSMWSLLCRSGIHYPEGGFYGLSDALATPFGWEPRRDLRKGSDIAAERGGEAPPGRTVYGLAPALGARKGEKPGKMPGCSLLLGRRVSCIPLQSGRVEGVVLEDGTYLRAPAVISNADFKKTFLSLVDPEGLPTLFLRRLASAPLTSSNLQVCLGVDPRRVDLSAFSDNSRIIHRREADEDGHEGGAVRPGARVPDPHLFATQELELCLLSADDPDLAPEGKAVLVIRTEAPHDPFLSFRDREGGRTPDYHAYKMLLAETLIKEAASLLPGLEDCVETVDVATPLTFEERAGRTGGAVAGWSSRYEENVGYTVELVRTPVEGLFMAGHQAFSMLALGGIPSALLSGLRAAEYVLAAAPPLKDMDPPGLPRGPSP